MKQEVKASKSLAESMRTDLNGLKSFMLEASRSLSSEQTRFEYCAEALGLSQKLKHNMAQLKSFSHYIDQAVKPLTALQDLVRKMGRHSNRFKVHIEFTSVRDYDPHKISSKRSGAV